MASETRRVSWIVAFLNAWQLAFWFIFFFVPIPRSHLNNVGYFQFFLEPINIAYSIFMLIKLVQVNARVSILVGTLINVASALIQTFTWFYWQIGTTANFSVGLTRFDSLYFSVGTLSGGTGNIFATSVLSRSLQTVQTVIDFVFTIFAVGMVVARMSDAIPTAARRLQGTRDQAASSDDDG